MKSRHMEMDEKWAEGGVVVVVGGEGEWEKGGNWLALPADMNWDVKGGKKREGR